MHYQTRHMEPVLRRLAKAFKVVLVTGARQVGKTTLLRHAFPQVRSFTFDPVQDLYHARRDPDLFLDNFAAPLVLDEIQYVPELLAAIKRRVDTRDDRGQYFLTGSQNLSVLRTVSESLAGRVGILHLDGFTPAEAAGKGNQESWLGRYLDNPDGFAQHPAPRLVPSAAPVMRMLWRGSLPGLLELEDADVPAYWNAYIQTYVERDVRLLCQPADLAAFGRFLRLAAALSGQEIVVAQLGREVGINPRTARNWLETLTHSFQWLELPPYHGNAIKRLSDKRKGHLCDTGMLCHLAALSSPAALMASARAGAVFESWGAVWVARQISRLTTRPALYHWRTGNGAKVDLVIEQADRLHPIEFKLGTNLRPHDFRGLRAFRETYGARVAPGIVIYAGDTPMCLNPTTLAIPWNAC
jgi:predicted AAA+ superfamily ATPase